MYNTGNNTLKFSKTRIAPTPSGYLHLGNIFSFALTSAIAQRTGAKVLLRIDDLDRTRANTEYVQDIFETLDFLDIPWHEGPQNVSEAETECSQLHRLGLYEKALQQLWDTGQVFACTCSRTEIEGAGTNGIYPGTCRHKNLPPDTKDAAWRLNTSLQTRLILKTFDGVTETTFPDEMHDFVIRKKDGYPAYQLASVIDDLHFGVDMVVRGQDLFNSTIAQLFLAALLGNNKFSEITFYHHPLLVSTSGQKLSKSAGATSIKYLRQNGYTAAHIYNMIAKMIDVKENVSTWQQLTDLITH